MKQTLSGTQMLVKTTFIFHSGHVTILLFFDTNAYVVGNTAAKHWYLHLKNKTHLEGGDNKTNKLFAIFCPASTPDILFQQASLFQQICMFTASVVN